MKTDVDQVDIDLTPAPPPAEPFQVMPPLTEAEYDALRAAIARDGIQVPVVVDQHGRVLDGHHRSTIAAELGIDCPRTVRQVADDDDAWRVAVELNCTRRHLTSEQKRSLIRVELARYPDDSDRAIARRIGCDHKTVGALRRPRESGEIPHGERLTDGYSYDIVGNLTGDANSAWALTASTDSLGQVGASAEGSFTGVPDCVADPVVPVGNHGQCVSSAVKAGFTGKPLAAIAKDVSKVGAFGTGTCVV